MGLDKQTLVIGGLLINVYEQPTSNGQHPLNIVFILHGRGGSSDDVYVDKFVERTWQVLDGQGTARKKDVTFVSFDQRNHGHRLVNEKCNDIWSKKAGEGNERHALDMYTIQAGTARDVSFLIDFLPAYLFPMGERKVAEWGVVGVSLGGHAAWIALKEDKRISFGVPVIGCPDYERLMAYRAERVLSRRIEAPIYPESFAEYIQAHDPASDASWVSGKRILVLCGEKDELVPWSAGKTFVDKIGCRVEIEKDAGHEVTDKMIDFVAEFIVGESN